MACEAGHSKIVRYLVGVAYADRHLPTRLGASPIWLAAKRGHLEVVQVLIEFKTMPDLPGPQGRTPLYIASQEGFLPVVQELTKHRPFPYGVDINKQDDLGWTPLLAATDEDHARVVRHLCSISGINRDAEATDGTTALDIAEERGLTDMLFSLVADQESLKPPENTLDCTAELTIAQGI